MHILWLKTELLHPIDKGGKIRTYHTLLHLKRRHRITYLTLDDGGAASDARTRATEYAHNVVTIPFNAPKKGSAAFWLDLAQNAVSSLPYAIAKYRSSDMRDAIRRVVRERDIDLVVCDFLFPSINVPDDLGIPILLFQHNVEAAIWERHFNTASHPLKRMYMREQWRRMRRWEARETNRFDHVVAVSPEDARAMTEAYGAPNVSAVPTGVDVDFFTPSGTIAREPGCIVFVGSMDWMPNEDGVAWFANQMLQRIIAEVPATRLVIVGRNPSSAVRSLATRFAQVEVTGTVDDVRPYFERADVVVVPLRVGGGTRIKIFEAMAMECGVVSTSIGAEGLPVRDGAELLIAESPDDFARACTALMKDSARRDRLGKNAAALVRRDFGWEAATDVFAEACEHTLLKSRDERTASVAGTA